MDDLSKMTARVRHHVSEETGSGLPTGGAPHQQLVTDAEGKALWEDRTHYAYTGMAEILPENEPVFDEDAGAFFVTEPLSVPLEKGMNCTVTYNGVEYNCPVQEVSEGDIQLIALGNIGALMGGEGTGEPFIFAPFPENTEMDGVYAQVMALDGAESVTIKITGEGEIVHRLDRKYLPEYIYGDEVKDVTFLSERTLEPVQTSDGLSVFLLTSPYDMPLVMNAIYTVMWNGVAYRCEPSDISSGSETYIGLTVNGVFQIGNELGEYSDAPFFGMIYAHDASKSLTVSVTGVVTTVHQVPDKYLPKLNLVNGSAEGSLRSVTAAEEDSSYTMGESAVALGVRSKASGRGAVAVAEGIAKGSCSFATGLGQAHGIHSFASGFGSVAKGDSAAAMGRRVTASRVGSLAIGRSNIKDTSGKYLFIIGNGVAMEDDPNYYDSNAHTVDGDGNAWFAGYVEGTKLILPSPNGTRWAITVGDDGTLSAAAVTE